MSQAKGLPRAPQAESKHGRGVLGLADGPIQRFAMAPKAQSRYGRGVLGWGGMTRAAEDESQATVQGLAVIGRHGSHTQNGHLEHHETEESDHQRPQL